MKPEITWKWKHKRTWKCNIKSMKMEPERTWKCNIKEHENATKKNMKMQHKRT